MSIAKAFPQMRGLLSGAAALYGVQICRKFVPLIAIPYLVRTLGPAGWGSVAFVASFADLMVLLLEFGFNLSATREIARHRNDPDKCRDIIGGVLGAQVVLILAAMAMAASAAALVPELARNPRMLLAGLAYAIVQGTLPLWFFQGLERMWQAAVLEVTGKLLGLAGIFLFVHSPENAWRVLLIYAIGPALGSVIGITMAVRWASPRMPSLALIRETFRKGWPMFVFRSGESLFGAGNAFILGLYAPAAAVGYFAAAEKIARASFGLLNPLREVLYPRLSRLYHQAHQDADHLARLGVTAICALGVLISAGLFVFAEFAVRVVAGEALPPIVSVLRILAVLPILLAVTNSIGLQSLLTQGREVVVNIIILAAGVFNLCLAMLLAPAYAETGMAISVVAAECSVALAMSVVVLLFPKLAGLPRTGLTPVSATEEA